MHSRRFLHRDLKPQNILLNKDGTVKLADFGLVRAVTIPLRNYTPEIITLWYRAPEILLGDDRYSESVDIWSVGAIFAELAKGSPMYRGRGVSEQILKILEVHGTPSYEEWPSFETLRMKYIIPIPQYPGQDYTAVLRVLEDDGIDLFKKFNVMNPAKRISARDALNHPYFKKSMSVIC